jgi:hypothetical protein
MLADVQEEATWRLNVWQLYQAVADKMSTVTTTPILSNIDNQVGTCAPDKQTHRQHGALTAHPLRLAAAWLDNRHCMARHQMHASHHVGTNGH